MSSNNQIESLISFISPPPSSNVSSLCKKGFSTLSTSTIVCIGNKTYCLGRNDYGQLGTGHLETPLRKPVVLGDFKPDDIEMIAMGGGHCLVLTTSRKERKVFAWGCNRQGQLGTGECFGHLKYPIEILPKLKVVTLACGLAFSMCLTDSGDVFSWGHDQFGQLGHETLFKDTHFPEPVKFLKGNKAKDIACGNATSYAITAGTVYCWGLNARGECGFKPDPEKKDVKYSGNKLHFEPDVFVCGGNHCFAYKDGFIYCWGYNADQQLGFKGEDIEWFPQKFQFFSDHVVYSIACGKDHTLFWTSKGLYTCGRYTNDLLCSVYEMYSRKFCVLGENRSKKSYQIWKITFFKHKTILSIGAGNAHSFCLTTDGLYGWGINDNGQLGGDEKIVHIPRKIEFPPE